MKGQIRGYKGTDENMQCRGMQFEVGKVYEVEGKPELCAHGIHFCERLSDVFRYYPFGFGYHNRYFEVESGYPDAITIIGKRKCVTTRIKFVRELSPMEVNRIRYGRYGVGRGRIGRGDGYRYGDGCGLGNGCGYGCSGHGNGYGYGYSGDGYGDGRSGDGDGGGYGIGTALHNILIWG